MVNWQNDPKELIGRKLWTVVYWSREDRIVQCAITDVLTADFPEIFTVTVKCHLSREDRKKRKPHFVGILREFNQIFYTRKEGKKFIKPMRSKYRRD